MKRLLIGAALLLLIPTAAMAQAGAGFGPHDLSTNDTGARVCVFCHTPHGASTVSGPPLWNHTLSTNTFTAYDSPTMNAADNNDWTGTGGNASALCMSCHDGSVGLGSLINPPNEGTITDPGVMGAVVANLGTDLSNDHPVAFTYDATLSGNDGELADPSTLTGAVQLFGAGNDQVECSSCHDAHNQNAGGFDAPFLVMTNQASQLCDTCHNK